VNDAWLARVAPSPPGAQVHRMAGEEPPEQAALAYEADLRATLGPVPSLDLVLLGMGADGHTASLFPGTPALDESARLCVAVAAPPPAQPPRRLTLTPRCLAWAAQIILLVAGADKAATLRRVLAGATNAPGATAADRALPAARVLAVARRAIVLCDAAAGAAP
jgi:6-phosphogluconolactonase